MTTTSTLASEKRTCPCKKLPWSLSSFTAAEFGDVHSLLRKCPASSGTNNNNGTSSTTTDFWNRRDEAGYTPLHLAAQHNHVAATSLLLKLGADVNGGVVTVEDSSSADNGNHTTTSRRKGQNVAAPLHRAAFSGATATMRLLLQEKNCNLFVQDTSFGDLKTPLHKASAGGRYLAVQLLLEELGTRGQLHTALRAKDSSSRTPLQVAQELCPREEQERESVARWDVVAGGVADWTKCRALLRDAETNNENKGQTSETTQEGTGSLPSPPLHLSTIDGCLDCEKYGDDDDSGMCLTSSWQAAFQAALGTAVDRSLSRQQTNDTIHNTMPSLSKDTGPPPPELTSSKLPASTAATSSSNPPVQAIGMACMMCGQQTISLYPRGKGQLVCKRCHRLAS
jgi:ankyrin repeat protein